MRSNVCDPKASFIRLSKETLTLKEFEEEYPFLQFDLGNIFNKPLRGKKLLGLPKSKHPTQIRRTNSPKYSKYYKYNTITNNPLER